MHTPHDQLILALCHPTADVKTLRGAIRPDIDWDRMVQKVERLGLAPLCYARLAPLATEDDFPATALARLAPLYHTQATENARIYQNARDVIAALSSGGMPVIVLKGAALAELAYPSIAVRPMQELDVMVRREHLDAADRLLRKLSYHPDDSYRPEEWYRRHHHHLAPYVSWERRSSLRLHRDILPPSMPGRLPIREIWDRSCTVQIAGVPVQVLSPSDFLFHLCLDLAMVHRFDGGLRSLCDVAQAIASWKSTVDWRSLLRSSYDLRVDRPLYYALSHAERMVGARVPGEILVQLKSTGGAGVLSDRALNALIPRLLMSDSTSPTRVPEWLRAELCGELLTVKARWRKALSVMRVFRNRAAGTR